MAFDELAQFGFQSIHGRHGITLSFGNQGSRDTISLDEFDFQSCDGNINCSAGYVTYSSSIRNMLACIAAKKGRTSSFEDLPLAEILGTGHCDPFSLARLSLAAHRMKEVILRADFMIHLSNELQTI